MTPSSAQTAADRDVVLAALERVQDPRSGTGLVSAGLVQALVVEEGRAGFMLEVPAADAKRYIAVRDAAEAALLVLPGIERAQVVMTAEGSGGGSGPRPHAPDLPANARGSQAAPDAPSEGVSRPRRTVQMPQPPPGDVTSNPAPPRAHAHSHAQAPPQSPMNPQSIPFVRHVIAVASGKGGVGKSTVAVNLAVALARLGLKTGLLDADVYGPSVPRMLGLTEEPQVGPDKKLIPLEAFGLKTVSIGLIVEEGSPMIWRGPMASSAVTQLLNDVKWGAADDLLDVLVIDMPPGTGDIQLTLAQKVRLSGAVIVSTPQEVALIDVRRGVAMFAKTGVPILGVVENMAYFPDPGTGAPIEIFGRGGARRTAEDVGALFLGEIPIDVALRRACDDGRPMVDAAPYSDTGQVFTAIAKKVAAALG